MNEDGYCCGTGGLMEVVMDGAHEIGMESGCIHFERFEAPVDAPSASSIEDRAYKVTLARQGTECIAEPSESIVDRLERHGICPPFSCRQGLCRSCEVTLISGEVEHRDYVLTNEERNEGRSLMICVSRATIAEIVIDL
ncbi:2Fe-2S iron-sulfur cluster-binding protein [Paraburkholderia phenoliruptrix]|uniref:2Fe-2S iron-sulfur cluster-binding protein n=1 Tax=Paraburkholderia phenoliruptrix TaxID=252970 RepID=UPI001427DD73|nr:2Fe-2S iron-sulfur cluster binding domain-containing protein [Paraburkholderia phenoliruptrix]